MSENGEKKPRLGQHQKSQIREHSVQYTNEGDPARENKELNAQIRAMHRKCPD